MSHTSHGAGTIPVVPDRSGNAVKNPLYYDLQCKDGVGCLPQRDRDLIFLAGIVGVPWQDIAVNPQSLALAVAVGHHVESVLEKSVRQDHEKLLCHFLAKRSLWVTEEFIVLDRRGMILHATERALDAIQSNRRGGIVDNTPTRFLKALPFEEWPTKLKELLPNASFDLVKNETSGIGAIVVMHARRRLPIG